MIAEWNVVSLLGQLMKFLDCEVFHIIVFKTAAWGSSSQKCRAEGILRMLSGDLTSSPCSVSNHLDNTITWTSYLTSSGLIIQTSSSQGFFKS